MGEVWLIQVLRPERLCPEGEGLYKPVCVCVCVCVSVSICLSVCLSVSVCMRACTYVRLCVSGVVKRPWVLQAI